ncbi:MAG TPA: hypothetical protein VMY76_08715 [Gemmatimonadales bacterium]|nr:hypothetical protein [Gemmatimonadales bacterium]
MTTDTVVREARLRPEFAERYPGIDPGVWYTAATLAEHLLARFIRHDASDPTPSPPRILHPGHFEFRGSAGMRGGRITLG